MTMKIVKVQSPRGRIKARLLLQPKPVEQEEDERSIFIEALLFGAMGIISAFPIAAMILAVARYL